MSALNSNRALLCVLLALAVLALCTDCRPALADSLFSQPEAGDRYAQGIYNDAGPVVRIGDVIKVRIRENSNANVSLSVSTSDEAKQEVSLDRQSGLFGRLLGKALDLLGAGSISYENKGDFSGDGKSGRNTRLDATVTALVVDSLDSGNLVVEGRKAVRVNGEQQIIIVRGVINPRDLDEDMQIDSDLVADAEIEYTGQGDLSRKAKPGFFSRVIDVLF